jgi:hypothetical protein
MAPDPKLGAFAVGYDPTEELSDEEWPCDGDDPRHMRVLVLANGDRRLTGGTRRRLGALPIRWYCAISTFEIALEQAAGKLALSLSGAVWMSELAERYASRAMCCWIPPCARRRPSCRRITATRAIASSSPQLNGSPFPS